MDLQPPLRGFPFLLAGFPGVDTPGYLPTSLRDWKCVSLTRSQAPPGNAFPRSTASTSGWHVPEPWWRAWLRSVIVTPIAGALGRATGSGTCHPVCCRCRWGLRGRFL